MTKKFDKIVSGYFNYLAQTFPVMCASDEFHLFPRVNQAGRYYHRMETLDAALIEESLDRLKDFYRDLSLLENEIQDLEQFIDIELIKANISGILIEFGRKRQWSYNPLLYLKIAFIGLDHVLIKPFQVPSEFTERFYGRMSAIPLLLYQGMRNIGSVPRSYHTSALAMLRDVNMYLTEVRDTMNRTNRMAGFDGGQAVFDGIFDSLYMFRKFLNSVMVVPDHHFSTDSLEITLKEHFLNDRSLQEIYEIAVHEWHETLGTLEKIQRRIDPDKTWQELYQACAPAGKEPIDILALYKAEMEDLCSFFTKKLAFADTVDPGIEIKETPVYLKSVRGTASFGAALSANPEEISYFYITTRLPGENVKPLEEKLQERFHKEYKFLTAHETVPGHHLIDSVRRKIKNPVRRQIESPLFYEGWASYAESLPAEFGYIEKPIEILIEHKRRLWRAARCQIDAGLPSGKLTTEQAEDLLMRVGFSPEEVRRQIDRFRLNPGYQLCYTLGTYEINELKKTYSSALGEEAFYRYLLEGGQLSYRHISERFTALLSEPAKGGENNNNTTR